MDCGYGKMEVGSDRSDVERDQEPNGRCSESVELLWLYFHLEIEVNPVLRGLFFILDFLWKKSSKTSTKTPG